MGYYMSNNIRGAGRKPLPENEKRKTIGVVLPPAIYNYVVESAEKNFMTAPEFIRELIKKDMIKSRE